MSFAVSGSLCSTPPVPILPSLPTLQQTSPSASPRLTRAVSTSPRSSLSPSVKSGGISPPSIVRGSGAITVSAPPVPTLNIHTANTLPPRITSPVTSAERDSGIFPRREFIVWVHTNLLIRLTQVEAVVRVIHRSFKLSSRRSKQPHEQTIHHSQDLQSSFML